MEALIDDLPEDIIDLVLQHWSAGQARLHRHFPCARLSGFNLIRRFFKVPLQVTAVAPSFFFRVLRVNSRHRLSLPDSRGTGARRMLWLLQHRRTQLMGATRGARVQLLSARSGVVAMDWTAPLELMVSAFPGRITGVVCSPYRLEGICRALGASLDAVQELVLLGVQDLIATPDLSSLPRLRHLTLLHMDCRQAVLLPRDTEVLWQLPRSSLRSLSIHMVADAAFARGYAARLPAAAGHLAALECLGLVLTCHVGAELPRRAEHHLLGCWVPALASLRSLSIDVRGPCYRLDPGYFRSCLPLLTALRSLTYLVPADAALDDDAAWVGCLPAWSLTELALVPPADARGLFGALPRLRALERLCIRRAEGQEDPPQLVLGSTRDLQALPPALTWLELEARAPSLLLAVGIGSCRRLAHLSLRLLLPQDRATATAYGSRTIEEMEASLGALTLLKSLEICIAEEASEVPRFMSLGLGRSLGRLPRLRTLDLHVSAAELPLVSRSAEVCCAASRRLTLRLGDVFSLPAAAGLSIEGLAARCPPHLSCIQLQDLAGNTVSARLEGRPAGACMHARPNKTIRLDEHTLPFGALFSRIRSWWRSGR